MLLMFCGMWFLYEKKNKQYYIVSYIKLNYLIVFYVNLTIFAFLLLNFWIDNNCFGYETYTIFDLFSFKISVFLLYSISQHPKSMKNVTQFLIVSQIGQESLILKGLFVTINK